MVDVELGQQVQVFSLVLASDTIDRAQIEQRRTFGAQGGSLVVSGKKSATPVGRPPCG